MYAKYLPEFGWQPYILTRGWPEGDPYHNPSLKIDGLPEDRFIHREVLSSEFETKTLQLRGFRGRLRDFFMPELANPAGVARVVERIVPNLWMDVRFDAVLATVPNLYPLRIACRMWRSRGAPWVADFRDLEEQEDGMGWTWREKFVRLRMKLRRGHLIKSARLITVVSKSHQCLMQRQYRNPVEVVYNGYDSSSAVEPNGSNGAKKFRIVYAGRILNQWYRDPTVLFEGLDRLFSTECAKRDEIQVEFYGSEPNLLTPILSRFGCAGSIKIVKRIPHAEVPRLLAGASCLLVLTNRGRVGVLTTKFFEYLPMNKPILCVPGDGGELDQVLNETGAGRSCPDAESVAATLSAWLSEWKNKGMVSVNANPKAIERFSRKRQTEVLARLLEKVCG